MKIFNKFTNAYLKNFSLYSLLFTVLASTSANAEETKINIQTGHLYKVNDIKINESNTFFASSSDDKTVKVYNIYTGKEILNISESIKSTKDLYFRKNNIVYLTADNKIKIFDTINNKIVKSINSTIDTFSVKNNLMIYKSGNTLYIYDLDNNKNLKTISNKSNLSAVSFSNDNKYIITGDKSGYLNLYDFKSSKSIKTKKVSALPIKNIIASDKYLLFSDEKSMSSLDLKTFKALYKTNAIVKDITLRDNNSFSFLENNIIKVLNLNNLKVLNTYYLNTNNPYNINTFDINKDYIIYNDNENIKLFDLKTKTTKYTNQNNTANLNAFSIIGKYLAYSIDNNINIIDMSNNQVKTLNRKYNNLVTSIQFNPDSELLASGDNSGNVELWNVPTQSTILNKKAHQGYISNFAFNVESIYFVSGENNGDLKIWRVGSGQELVTLKGHTNKINSINYHPDNERIVTTSDDNTLKLWDTIDAKFLRNLRFSSKVNSAVFSPKGDMIAVGTGDPLKVNEKYYGLSLWGTETLDKIYDLKGHESSVTFTAFNRAGDIFASGSDDNTIKLWNISDQKNYLTLKGHSDEIKYISFSAPSKNRLISISKDNTVRIWDLTTGKELAKIIIFKMNKYIMVNSQNNICSSSNLENDEIERYLSFYNTSELNFKDNYDKYNNCSEVIKSLGY